MRDRLIRAFRYITYFGTALYGIGFMLTDWINWDIKSSLFESMQGIDPSLPELWGVFAVIAVAFAILPKSWTGGIGNNLGHTLGVIVWLFAGAIYVQTGYFLVAGTVAVVYLAMWVAAYFVTELPRQHRSTMLHLSRWS